MPSTRTRLAIAALVTTALGTAVAVIPSYAQEAGAAAMAPAAAAAPGAPHARPDGIDYRRGEGPMGMLPFGRIHNLMEIFDTDANGVVTQAEIDAVRAGELAEYDANGDGQLNLEEYTAYWTARMLERIVDAFQQLDANGDGNVTMEEWNAGIGTIVARLDQDGDAALGPTDMPQHAMDGERGPHAGRGGPDGGHGPDRMIIIRPAR